ncbi:hypothetical protein [Clostridiisalibacter paucivorans]|uniref:hypothetical protein n=1 Tax=Clostridiisalibacter paucivorans TaxID=408753 RepID=UPI00047A7CE1|nr:hypothetical protein [Clostridiisalibacter paucivorans]
MTNHEKHLSELKNNLEKAKTLKYKAEARLEQLNRQQQDIIDELNDLGVSPDDLDEEIEKLEKEIEKLFKKATELLPTDILKND